MKLADRFILWANPVCMACLRIRFSPVHGAARLFGMCPGDRS